MSVYREPRTGRWQFEFDHYIDGRRVRTRKLLPEGWTRAQAEAYDRAEGAALYAIASGIARPRRHIDDAVAAYARERLPALKHGAGVERELEQFREWWTGRPIDQLHTVCAEYAADQAGALAPATIRNRLAYLRAACRWAWRVHGMAETDPGARVVVPKVDNARDTTITREQMVRLARACRHRGVRALVRIAFYTGMRVSEIQRAQRADGLFVLPTTKNGSPRLVPIPPIVSTAARVPPPRRSEIDYYWPLAREACKLPHVRLHDIRHSTASIMVSSGVDLGTVGAVLGHKSTQTTKRYAHYAVDRLAGALAAVKSRRS